MSFEPVQEPRPNRRIGLKVGLIGAGVIAGAIGATALGATAATTGGSTSGTATSGYGAGYAAAPNGTAPNGTAPNGTAPSGAPSGPPGRMGGGPHGPGMGGARPVRGDEKSVTAAQAATLRAAALKAVPGGTVVRVETDSGDAAYEVHMTRSDGSAVTVKFDKNLALKGVEDGMGK